MGRPVVLSNGQLFVGLNENGLVNDFYFPYVGLDNLTNARHVPHKIGVWVDNQFSWTDDGTWKIEVDSLNDALISNISLKSDKLKIELKLNDGIDSEHNAFLRYITIKNKDSKKREIRLFMHQVFEISRYGRSDTALYVPDDHYILDYKGAYCLLIAGKFENGDDFDQYAVGGYDMSGKNGTFRDAEDGKLSNNPVEHSGVDSTIRFSREIEGNKSDTICYWIIAGDNQADIQTIHQAFKKQDIALRMEAIRRHWQKWLSDSDVKLPDYHTNFLTNSLLTIKAHCDNHGSVLASGDSSIFNYGRDYYCYCWPRDASYALWPLIRLGHFEEARKFFEFARDTVHKDGYLMHKYQPDRAIGSTWHPLVHGKRKELAIQEDETASVVFMMGEYFEATQDMTFLTSFYPSFIAPAANFMTSFIDDQTGLPHASYDLWEEKFLTTTYTVSTVIAGLQTAAKFAEVLGYQEDAAKWATGAQMMLNNLDKLLTPDGYFGKGFLLNEDGSITHDNTLDISNLYGPFMFAGLPLKDPRLIKTAKEVSARLLNSSPAGGVIRYEKDHYFLDKTKYKGNPWPVCTLWLAQFYATCGKTEDAKKLLNWVLKRAHKSGALSEQVDAETMDPKSVLPLVWSHAELVNTILDLSGKD